MSMPTSRRFFCLAMISLYIFVIVLQSSIYINGDMSWLMNASLRMLAGGTYLNDFFELNPPFILYLYVPPVLFANHFSLSHIAVLQAYVFLLASISIAASYFLIKKIFSTQEEFKSDLFTLALAFILLVFPIYEFGEREHLLLIFSMPYLFLIVYRLQGNRINSSLAACIGIFAALGFAIKPFFLFTPLLIELYYIFFQRSFRSLIRPETLAISVVFVIYLAAILIFHRDYLFIVLPFALKIYNTTYGVTYSSALLYDPELFCGFAFLFYLIFYENNPYKILSTVLLLAQTGFLLAYITQHNVLYYHILPAFSITLLLFALFFMLALSQNWNLRQAFFMGLAGLLSLSFLLLFDKPNLVLLILFHPIAFNGFFAVLLCLIFYWAQKQKNIFHVVICIAAMIAMSASFSKMIVYTPWYPYQLLLTLLFLSLLVIFYFVRQKQSHYLFLTLFSISLFAYPYNLLNMLYLRTHAYQEKVETIVKFMQAQAFHKPVYFFTTRTDLEYPAIDYAGSKPISRFASLAWLHGLSSLSPSSKKNASSALTTTRDFFVNMTIDDFIRHQPFLVFVDINKYDSYLGGFTFDYLKFYLQYPRFQDIWKHYHYVTSIQNAPLVELAVYQRDNS